jgi:Tol biopolymer transport system component
MVSNAVIVFVVAMMSMAVAGQGARPQDVELQRAIRTETVEGDLPAALRQYGALAVKYATSDRSVAAQALVHQAQLYQQLGDARWRSVLEKVVAEYADQGQPAEQARRALGGSTRRITQERVSAGVGDKGVDVVSPDEKWLVFASRDGFVIRRNGSNQDYVSVPKADSPVFSPDSKRVAYNDWSKTPSEFRVASLEGRWNPRTVKTSPADVRYLNPGGWSADGQSILVEIVHQDVRDTDRDYSKEIAWLSLATGQTRVLADVGQRRPQDPGEKVSLSPDGKWIVYSAFPAEAANDRRPKEDRERFLYLLPAQGGTPTELVGGSVNVRPLWTPDSRSVVFVSNRTGTFGVWSVKVEGKRESPVVEMASSGRLAAIAITKSGALYFARNQTGTDLLAAEVRPDGRVGAPVLLPTREAGSSFAPVASPDHRFIAYLRARKDRPGERYSLVVHSMSDHTERVFDSQDLRYARPQWFADGTRLLVSGDSGFVVDLMSGAFTPAAQALGLTGNIFRFTQVSLSPDGKTAYVAEPVVEGQGGIVNLNAVPFTITAVEVPGGTRRVVLSADTGDPAVKRDPRRSDLMVSPDGRWLAFITAKNGVNVGSLWVVGVDGQGLRELSTSASNRVVAWAPDSRSIYFLEQRGDLSHLMRVPAAGGAGDDTGLTLPYDKQRAGTLAGNQLVFAQESPVHELWVVKNFAARGN